VRTIALDPVTWDLYKDAAGNIALAPRSVELAQDVASAIRTFRGELWYDKTRGMPYLELILGQPGLPGRRPPAGFIIAQLKALALSIPGVAAVVVTLDPLTPTRKLTGKIVVTSHGGETATLTIGGDAPWYQIAVGP
jgi:hypothetical protein